MRSVPKSLSTKTVYPPETKCIYCGSDTKILTGEHIIPFAFGGHYELPSSCCHDCRKEIQRFEGPVIKQMFGKFLVKYSLPTYNPKGRPKTLRVNSYVGHRPVQFEMDQKKHPGTLAMPVFSVPRALVGLKGTNQNRHQRMSVWTYPPMGKMSLITPPLMTNFRVGRVLITPFAKFLAKIGHGFAVAHYGNDFEPFLLPMILTATQEYADFVGGDGRPQKATTHFHSVEFSREVVGDETLLLAHIRLFSVLGAPLYYVVVGRIKPASQEVRGKESPVQEA